MTLMEALADEAASGGIELVAVFLTAIGALLLVLLPIGYRMFRVNLRSDLHLFIQMWTLVLGITVFYADVVFCWGIPLETKIAWSRWMWLLVFGLIASASLTQIVRLWELRQAAEKEFAK